MHLEARARSRNVFRDAYAHAALPRLRHAQRGRVLHDSKLHKVPEVLRNCRLLARFRLELLLRGARGSVVPLPLLLVTERVEYGVVAQKGNRDAVSQRGTAARTIGITNAQM